MFDVHQIDIRTSINIAKKSYINKIKHVALNIYDIKLSKQDYTTFRERLNDEKDTSIYIDFDLEVSFINEFLLLKNVNLFDRQIIVQLIIVRDIAEKKIYLFLFLFVQVYRSYAA